MSDQTKDERAPEDIETTDAERTQGSVDGDKPASRYDLGVGSVLEILSARRVHLGGSTGCGAA